MKPWQIVAHRGIQDVAPENTIIAYQRALELGADAVELDVRLTADHVPVVYHYFYLQENTSAAGPIFQYSLKQLHNVKVYGNKTNIKEANIPTLTEVMEILGGKIGLEIEIKGPEPEAPEIIGRILNQYRMLWDTIEVTSYEPAILLAIRQICPAITVDLLFPKSEAWMGLDVIVYRAVHLSRLAHARAVHLHPSQLTESVLSVIREHGFEIHAWDVNDEQSFALITQLGIPRLCTDRYTQAFEFRERHPH